MGLEQQLLLAFIAGFAYFTRRFCGDLFLERAVVLGPITGLILGDLQAGLIIGASLELIFIGAADIGGSVPPNLAIGSVLGTAFAINTGLNPEQAVAIAVPAALIGAFGELLAKAVSSVFVTMAERFADTANVRGIAAMVHVGNFVHFLCFAVPAFLGLHLGTDAVRRLSETIEGPVQNGLTTAGAVLPALGFALLLSTLATRALIPFFFAGFLLAAYTDFGVLGSAVLGLMVAVLWVTQKGGIQLVHHEDHGPATESVTVPPRERRRIYWRSFAVQSAFSFDRMQAIGFTWTLMPYLRQLYPQRDDLAAALRRHLVFFNTHPWVPGPVLALVSDLENRNASRTAAVHATELAPATGATTTETGRASRGEDEPPEDAKASRDETTRTMQGMKGSLMGPLAGIGDSTFHGTLRPVFSGVSSSLALQGLVIAPAVFFIPVNIVHVTIRWVTQSYGFRFGRSLFERVDQAALKRLTEGAAITGLVGVGALVGTWLSITTPLSYTQGEETVRVQDMLNNVMPKLLPLTFTLLAFWAVRRRINAALVMLALAAVGFGLGAVGVLGAPA